MKTIKEWKATLIMVAIVCTTFIQLKAQDNPEKTDISPTPEFPQFTKIQLSGTATVYLNQGTEQKVIIEKTEKSKEKVDLDVKNGTLKLNSKTPLKIYITYVSIEKLEVSGAIDVTGKDVVKGERFNIQASGAAEVTMMFDVNTLTTNSSGAADLKLSGKATMHDFQTSGASDLSAYDLETVTTRCDLTGASNAKVWATNDLIANVSGASDIQYKGNPTNRKIELSGVGTSKNIASKSDTVKVSIGDLDIRITEKPKNNNDEEGEDTTVSKNDKDDFKFNGHWSGVELGFNGFLNTSNKLEIPDAYGFMKLNQEKSIAVHLNLIEKNINLIHNKFGIITGLGLKFNNYRFDNNVVLMKDTSIFYGFKDNSGANSYMKSKLTVTSLTLPIIFEFQTNSKAKSNSFHIGAGVIGSARIGSHSKIVFNNENTKEKTKSKDDYYLSPFTAEVTGRIGWGFLNLFANYDIASAFETSKGPELYPFTIGLTFGID